jgi:uncharacterized membrane protein
MRVDSGDLRLPLNLIRRRPIPHHQSAHRMSAHTPPTASTFRFGQESGVGLSDWSVEWTLKRNCSLAPRQLLMFYLLLCAMSLSVASFWWWFGAPMVMPFAWLELLAVGIALLVYARHATDLEHIALRHGCLTVEHASGNRRERVEFQPAWVRVEPETGDSSLVELSGQGRKIAVGRFVRPEMRSQLARELRTALSLSHRQAAPASL